MPASDPAILPDHPERRLAVAHAMASARDGLATLFALDERLGELVSRAREPGIGLMRLVWWRDALAALDDAPPPAEPLLTAAAELSAHGIAGRDLAPLAEGWEVLLDDPGIDDATAATHVRERGARLFALGGRVLGDGAGPDAATDAARLAAAGEGWALVDLARHFAPPDRRGALLDAAKAPLERAMATRWPAALRPLGMLAALALRDARSDAGALAPPASPARLLRLLAHRWTGR